MLKLAKRTSLLGMFLLCYFLVAASPCEKKNGEEASQSGEDGASPCINEEDDDGTTTVTEISETETEVTETEQPPKSSRPQSKNMRKTKHQKFSSITVGDTKTDSNSSTVFFQHTTNEKTHTRWTHFAAPYGHPEEKDDDNDSPSNAPGKAPPMNFAFGGYPNAFGGMGG